MCRNERTKIKEEWVSVTHGVWDRSSVISCLHISVLCGPARLHQFQATLFPTCSQLLRSCTGSFPTSPSMGIAWRTSSKIAGLHPQSLWFSRSGWGWGFAFLKNSQVMLSQDHTLRTSYQLPSQSTENACDECGSSFWNLTYAEVPQILWLHNSQAYQSPLLLLTILSHPGLANPVLHPNLFCLWHPIQMAPSVGNVHYPSSPSWDSSYAQLSRHLISLSISFTMVFLLQLSVHKNYAWFIVVSYVVTSTLLAQTNSSVDMYSVKMLNLEKHLSIYFHILYS